MDTNSDDLSDLENRLAALPPADEGLAVDRMLFAAGRASARAGAIRYGWPAVAACLALVICGLSLRLIAEHGERLALAEQLRLARSQEPVAVPLPELIAAPASDDPPAADSLLSSYRILADGLDGLSRAPAMPPAPSPQGPPPRAPAILRARPVDGWLDL